MQIFSWKFILSLLLLFALMVIANHFVYKNVFLARKVAFEDSLQPLKSKMHESFAILRKNPIFNELQQTHNFEPFASQHVSWTLNGINSLRGISHQNLRELFKEYKDWKTNDVKLRELMTDVRVHTVDTNWISQAREFDYWNIVDSKSIQAILPGYQKLTPLKKAEAFSNFPIPNFDELRFWAFLHFVKKYKQLDIEEGLADFRHLTKLIYSTKTFAGSLSAIQMLRDESFLIRRLHLKDYTPVENEVISALETSITGWNQILSFSVFRDIPVDIQDYANLQFGYCASAWDLSQNSATFALLEPRFLFETDHSVEVERVRKSISQLHKTCQTKNFDESISRAPAQENSFGFDRITFSKEDLQLILEFLEKIDISDIPYSRRIVGLMMFENPIKSLPNSNSKALMKK